MLTVENPISIITLDVWPKIHEVMSPRKEKWVWQGGWRSGITLQINVLHQDSKAKLNNDKQLFLFLTMRCLCVMDVDGGWTASRRTQGDGMGLDGPSQGRRQSMMQRRRSPLTTLYRLSPWPATFCKLGCVKTPSFMRFGRPNTFSLTEVK